MRKNREIRNQNLFSVKQDLACWTLGICSHGTAQNKGSQTFALQVQHDRQRVPLQHLLAFVIQLNSQCGSPAFLDKGKIKADKH